MPDKKAPRWTDEEVRQLFEIVAGYDSAAQGLREAAKQLRRPHGATKLKYYNERKRGRRVGHDPDLSDHDLAQLAQLARALRNELDRRRSLLDDIAGELG